MIKYETEIEVEKNRLYTIDFPNATAIIRHSSLIFVSGQLETLTINYHCLFGNSFFITLPTQEEYEKTLKDANLMMQNKPIE